MLSYILITPAHNEEAFIEKTILSVIDQTILPIRWVIINDGSSDRTGQIIKAYAERYDWIRCIQTPERNDRQFASKVYAFNAGYETVKNMKFDIIGSLDADISFGKDYFEYLLNKIQQDPELGVVGTDYIEGEFHSFKDSYINEQHVNGGCQLFRRECYEDIGGYIPIKEGGIDWVAVTTARMKGWKTYSFSDRVFTHHSNIGRTYGNIFLIQFHYGKKDYFLGGHPLWEIFRCAFQMMKKPYFIGGLFIFLGYFWSWIKRLNKPVSRELVKFYRVEQMKRLKNLIINRMKFNRKNS